MPDLPVVIKDGQDAMYKLTTPGEGQWTVQRNMPDPYMMKMMSGRSETQGYEG